ncbi:transposase family protein, partial [Streptomyces mirabilis]|uniref:transposase family protein n=1 Tax=Streptomyces mirabilis TaxID=68239 RepID=UPI003685D91D
MAGPKYELVFIDRLLVTPVRLRTGLTHKALGVLYKVGSSTIGRAIREVRPPGGGRGVAGAPPRGRPGGGRVVRCCAEGGGVWGCG